MELFFSPAESVCLMDYKTYVSSVHSCTKQHDMSFHSHFSKWLKELPNRQRLLLNVHNISTLTAVHKS